MKNLFKMFIAIIVFMCFITNKNILAEENTNHLINDVLYAQNINPVSMYDNSVIQTQNEIYFIKYSFIKLGRLIDYYLIEDNIYIIYENNNTYYIEIVNKNGETIKKEKLGLIVKDSYFLDKIYIVGTRYDNATIHIYDKELSKETIYDYGGTGYEEFVHIDIIENSIYLFGLKDGISHNSHFSNVGNETDKKSFMIKLNEKFKIDKTLYFNYNSEEELINNIILNDNKFYFILSTKEKCFYQYTVDKNLKVKECFELSLFNDEKNIILLNNINMDKYKIYIYLNDNNICYDVITNKLEYTYKLFKENIEILYIENIKGYLDIYYSYDNSIYKLSICEYHIDYTKDKIIEYNDKTLKDISHFKVDSLFTNLRFKYDDNLNEKINLSKSDIYKAFYQTKIDNFEIPISTNYIVLPYINIINEGIYERGYILNFSDDLYINDIQVYPGEVLNQSGIVNVKHVTKEKTYEFNIYLVDKYYKDFTINYQTSDIEVPPGSIYQYKMELSDFKEVKNIYVNDKVYPHEQKDNQLIIDFVSSESSCIKLYNINYIEFVDGTVYNVNEKIKIKSLKKLPIIDIYNIDDSINYNILDYDFTITDVIINYYKDNELIKKEKTYLSNSTVKINDENIYIEVILQYEDGSNKYYEETLFQIKASSYFEEELFNMNFEYNEDTLSKINIKVNNSLKLKVMSCETNNVSLANYITNDSDLNIVLISIVSAIIFLITTGIIILFKKRKISR